VTPDGPADVTAHAPADVGAHAAGGTRAEPSTGLRPRPGVPPEVLAVIAAAADEVWAVAAPAPPEGDAPYLPWRFSGRWWHRPLPTRRARPYPIRPT
jgi:hypothetical protein